MQKIAGYSRAIWRWTQDLCALWVQPFAAFIALVTGSLLTYEFAAWRNKYPSWSGPLDWIEGLMPLVFVVSAGTALAAGLIGTRRSKKVTELYNQLQEQRGQIAEVGNVIVILFDGLLLNLANKLELDQGSQARLSLYVHDAERRAFIPCGRYSRNPDFIQPGRTTYPDDQGCIAVGWRKGWHFDNQIPPESQAVARRTYNLRNYSIPEWTTDSIRMKSTLYAVKRLDNLEGKAIAVLVVEAINPDHFTEADLRDTINGSINDYARVIHELRAYVPNPAKAAESGL